MSAVPKPGFLQNLVSTFKAKSPTATSSHLTVAALPAAVAGVGSQATDRKISRLEEIGLRLKNERAELRASRLASQQAAVVTAPVAAVPAAVAPAPAAALTITTPSAIVSPPVPVAVVPVPAAVVPSPVQAPVAIMDRAEIEAIATTATSAADRWNALAYLEELNAGNCPTAFVPQSAIHAEVAALNALLPAADGRERWRIQAQIEAVENGTALPGSYVEPADRSREIAAIVSIIETSSSPSERWRAVAHLEKLERGENPGAFVSDAALADERAGIVAKLETETSPRARWNLLVALDRLD